MYKNEVLYVSRLRVWTAALYFKPIHRIFCIIRSQLAQPLSVAFWLHSISFNSLQHILIVQHFFTSFSFLWKNILTGNTYSLITSGRRVAEASRLLVRRIAKTNVWLSSYRSNAHDSSRAWRNKRKKQKCTVRTVNGQKALLNLFIETSGGGVISGRSARRNYHYKLEITLRESKCRTGFVSGGRGIRCAEEEKKEEDSKCTKFSLTDLVSSIKPFLAN